MAEGINNLPLFLRGNVECAPVLRIKTGQILSGLVLEVHADKAVLLLQGVNVVAELETGIVPGERVVLQVEELTPDRKILLKKMDSAGSRQNIEQQELEPFCNILVYSMEAKNHCGTVAPQQTAVFSAAPSSADELRRRKQPFP